MQIKEKFGTLRLYYSGANDDAMVACEAAENASRFVCESCGMPGRLRTQGWNKTYCDDCDQERDRI